MKALTLTANRDEHGYPDFEKRVLDFDGSLCGIGFVHKGQMQPTRIFLETLVIHQNHIYGWAGGENGKPVCKFWLDCTELTIDLDKATITSSTGLYIVVYL